MLDTGILQLRFIAIKGLDYLPWLLFEHCLISPEITKSNIKYQVVIDF